MDRQQLHDRLQQLDAELRQVESVDDDDRKLLQRLAADIRDLLNAPEGEDVHQYGRFGEGLREGVERLEARHPDLTMMMGQIAEMLARMGI